MKNRYFVIDQTLDHQWYEDTFGFVINEKIKKVWRIKKVNPLVMIEDRHEIHHILHNAVAPLKTLIEISEEEWVLFI